MEQGPPMGAQLQEDLPGKQPLKAATVAAFIFSHFFTPVFYFFFAISKIGVYL